MVLQRAEATNAEDAYLDLLKKALTFSLWPEPPRPVVGRRGWRRTTLRALYSLLGRWNLVLARTVDVSDGDRFEGRNFPVLGHTMVGVRRLDHLQECIETVIREDVPGDLIEAGVWRGGCSIFMRAVLRVNGVEGRNVWLADSFEGHPPPRPDLYPADRGTGFERWEFQAVSLQEVLQNFENYGLLDSSVRNLKGRFNETLACAPFPELALIRLDAVSYGSTIEALRLLYPKLSPGGFVVVDDYGASPQCRAAVDDFRREHDVHGELRFGDWTSVCWRR
jgi:O-methyltransferase